jgi:hypothetical protein
VVVTSTAFLTVPRQLSCCPDFLSTYGVSVRRIVSLGGWLTELAQEASARVSTGLRISSSLSPRSLIVVPRSALGLGLGLDLHCISSAPAVFSASQFESRPVPELNGLQRRTSCTSGQRTGIDDAMRIVFPSTLQA